MGLHLSDARWRAAIVVAVAPAARPPQPACGRRPHQRAQNFLVRNVQDFVNIVRLSEPRQLAAAGVTRRLGEESALPRRPLTWIGSPVVPPSRRPPAQGQVIAGKMPCRAPGWRADRRCGDRVATGAPRPASAAAM
jgi:hypothetical protein